jgi:hypothetical protein
MRLSLLFTIMGVAASGLGADLAQSFAQPAAKGEEEKPWLTYLARSQVLLSAGDVAAEEGSAPDCSCCGAGLGYRRRRAGDADIYFVTNSTLTNLSAECVFRISGKVPEFWNPADGSIAPVPVFVVEAGQTRLPLRFAPAGSAFVVFRPGESKRHATRLVFTPSASEEQTVSAIPAYEVRMEKRGPLLLAWQPGTFDITLADGRTVKKQVYEVPAPFAVEGVCPLAGWVAYEKRLLVPDDLMGPGRRMVLDLGRVSHAAAVTLNGRELGVLWRPPYVVDVTEHLKVGENALRVRLTNRRASGADSLPSEPGQLGPVCIRTVFELPGR